MPLSLSLCNHEQDQWRHPGSITMKVPLVGDAFYGIAQRRHHTSVRARVVLYGMKERTSPRWDTSGQTQWPPFPSRNSASSNRQAQ